MATAMIRRLVLPLLILGCWGCASSGGETETAKPGAQQNDAIVDDIGGSLRKLRDDVKALVRSLENPESVEDPTSLRGRIRKEEERLSQKARELRTRLAKAIAPTADAKTEAEGSAPSKPGSRAQLMEELEETEAELDKVRQELDQQQP